MRRTRDWFKFAALVGVAFALAVGFASMVDLPENSMAQPATSLATLATQDPQRPVVPEAQPLADLSNSFTAVAEAVREAVVFIEVDVTRQQSFHETRPLPPPFDRFFDVPEGQEPRVQEGTGSGFLISSDGYILTNNHVVENADRVRVRLFDQQRYDNARIVGRDPLTDVAVIKVDGRDLPTVPLGNSDDVRIGEWVLAVGNPLGESFTFTVTAGIVSGRGRLLNGLQRSSWAIQDFIQTDAAINRGNSGGPLVNVRGEVIGINSAIASPSGFYTGYGFAIPINLVRNVADQLIASGKVTRAQLGVQIGAVSPELAEYVGLDEIRGVHVARFSADDSPAKRAGLQEGDVIVELDGKEVRYGAQLQQMVGFRRPGDVVQVTVQRKGGERQIYGVRLGEANTGPETVARAAPSEPAEESGFESRLGIAVNPFGRETAVRYGLDEGLVGLAVVDVDRRGPAHEKLFKSSPQDRTFEVITHVNDQRVRSRRDLENALSGVRPGEIIPVRSVLVGPNGIISSRPVYLRVAAGMQ